MNIIDRISSARWEFCERYKSSPTKLYMHPDLRDELYRAVEPYMIYVTPINGNDIYMDMRIVEVCPLDYLEVG